MRNKRNSNKISLSVNFISPATFRTYFFSIKFSRRSYITIDIAPLSPALTIKLIIGKKLRYCFEYSKAYRNKYTNVSEKKYNLEITRQGILPLFIFLAEFITDLLIRIWNGKELFFSFLLFHFRVMNFS